MNWLKGKLWITIELAGLALIMSFPGATVAQKAEQSVGPVKVSAKTIDITNNQWILSGGRPRAYTVDGRMDIQADKIVVDLNPKPKSKQDYVTRVTAIGSVDVKADMADRSARVKSGQAVYFQSEQKVEFLKDVAAVIVSPQLAEPSNIAAAKITLWLNAGPDQTKIRVEGEPAELRVTPKETPKAPGAKKKG